ncbi:MAG: LptF/LptG family permease [Bacteroidales bacterium]|nr:LptF/LptG family permease [Bacteroidales bacterium]
MKKLDRLILRSFIGPLVLTFTIAVFVLLMQFVWKYIDDMVGKGLAFNVIAELLLYASATFVPMALPIAVLFASIMTMGNFGEKYELVAMKAGGISITRVMMPMAVVVLMLTGVAFYFANNVMPEAMLRYRMTLYDVTRKKPAVNIRTGEYYQDIEGYVIRIGAKAQDGNTLHDIIIYDHSRGIAETNVIVARSGVMQTTLDNRYLLFTLDTGYSYTEPTNGENYHKRPLTTVAFERQTIAFDISSFAYSKSGEDLFKGSYQMMNVHQLNESVEALTGNLQGRYDDIRRDLVEPLRLWRAYTSDTAIAHAPKPVSVNDLYSRVDDPLQRNRMKSRAQYVATTAGIDVRNYEDMIRGDIEYINRHEIEKQRKFTLSVACLLLFLIGAPFGSIVRKGGLGVPLVASVAFFVLYYVVGMIAEKAVRESAMGPEGMWISSLVMLPIGLFFTFQATSDSSFFDSAAWRRFFRRLVAKVGLKPAAQS